MDVFHVAPGAVVSVSLKLSVASPFLLLLRDSLVAEVFAVSACCPFPASASLHSYPRPVPIPSASVDWKVNPRVVWPLVLERWFWNGYLLVNFLI